MRELSLQLNELETKSRTTESTSEANEATILKANERLSSMEKELKKLSIDGLEGGHSKFIHIVVLYFPYTREN